MGMSIDTYTFNKEVLLNEIFLKSVKEVGIEEILEVMNHHGLTTGDRWVIMCVDYWEDYNSYYNFIGDIEFLTGIDWYKLDDKKNERSRVDNGSERLFKEEEEDEIPF